MKSILLFMFAFMPMFTYAQGFGDDPDEPIRKKKASSTVIDQLSPSFTVKTKADSMDYELAYMRYCVTKFHKQHGTGVSLQIIGCAITFIYIPLASGSSNSSSYSFMPIIGGVVGLAGTAITLNSFKWIKKAGIKPARYGVGFEIDLD